MSTQHEIPNYSAWSRNDLITETTRLALAVEDAEKRGRETLALVKREAYHQAMAALMDLSTPFDAGAAERARQTRKSHILRAEACRYERLGLTEAMSA